MSNDKPAKPAADALVKELKSSLAKDRPRMWKRVLVLVVICSLILGLVTWLLLPRPRPPVLQVVALDGVFIPIETPKARGLVFPPPGDDSAPRLSGHSVVFDDQQNPEIIAISDADGQAAAAWPMGKDEMAAFFVRFVDRDRRQASAKESGRLFVWPRDARIVIVDADETLAGPDDVAAAAALNKAAEDGWRVVYLALAADKPHDFRQARSRIDRMVNLPTGPILGRPLPAVASINEARRDIVQMLRAKFAKQLAFIVQSAESADACKRLELRVIRIGDAATPTWADVKLD